MIENLIMPGMANSGGSNALVVDSRLASVASSFGGASVGEAPKSPITLVDPPDPFPPPDAFFRANKLAKENPTADASPSARIAKEESGRHALDPMEVADNDAPEPLNFSMPQLSADSFVAVAASAADDAGNDAPPVPVDVPQSAPVLPEFDFDAGGSNVATGMGQSGGFDMNLPDIGPDPAQMTAAHQAYTQVQSLVGMTPDVAAISFSA